MNCIPWAIYCQNLGCYCGFKVLQCSFCARTFSVGGVWEPLEVARNPIYDNITRPLIPRFAFQEISRTRSFVLLNWCTAAVQLLWPRYWMGLVFCCWEITVFTNIAIKLLMLFLVIICCEASVWMLVIEAPKASQPQNHYSCRVVLETQNQCRIKRNGVD